MPDKDRIMAAQVVLAQHPDSAERAQRAFEVIGFRTGPVVGGSFSIEGTPALFHKIFGRKLVTRHDGAVCEAGRLDAPVNQLTLEQLPRSLRDVVDGVIFSAPPAFGPGALP